MKTIDIIQQIALILFMLSSGVIVHLHNKEIKQLKEHEVQLYQAIKAQKYVTDVLTQEVIK